MTTIQHPDSQFVDLGRLITLIDGVFAVALILLVLDLKLPAGNANLGSALKQMLPGFLVYLIVFSAVVGYWSIHHGNFHHIAHEEGTLVVLSLVYFLFVMLFPLAASIVRANPLDPLATVCLSANCLLYCISAWATWTYAAKDLRLLTNENYSLKLKKIARIMLLVGIGLAIAIPLAFLHVYLVYFIWIVFASTVTWWSRTVKRKAS